MKIEKKYKKKCLSKIERMITICDTTLKKELFQSLKEYSIEKKKIELKKIPKYYRNCQKEILSSIYLIKSIHLYQK